MCQDGSPACRWAVLLCNRVWKHADVPDARHISLLAAVFKKGDVHKCDVKYLSCLIRLFGAKGTRCRRIVDAWSRGAHRITVDAFSMDLTNLRCIISPVCA